MESSNVYQAETRGLSSLLCWNHVSRLPLEKSLILAKVTNASALAASLFRIILSSVTYDSPDQTFYSVRVTTCMLVDLFLIPMCAKRG